MPDGTKIEPRYPARLYSSATSRDQLEKLVNKLNYREDQKAKRNIEIRTSFIPTDIMESFRDRLQIEIPSEKDFRYIYNTVFKKYFLGFFIDKQIYGPKEFSRHQEQWPKLF